MQNLKELLTYEKPYLVFNVVHVSSSKLVRDIQVFSFNNETKTFEHISNLVALELDMPFKNNGVRIKGVGMDMCFALKNRIEDSIEVLTGKHIAISMSSTVKENDMYSFLNKTISYINTL